MRISRQDVANAVGFLVSRTVFALLILGVIVAAAAAVTGVLWAEVTAFLWAGNHFGGWVAIFAALVLVAVDFVVCVEAADRFYR